MDNRNAHLKELKNTLDKVLGSGTAKPAKKSAGKKILNLPASELPIKPLTLKELHEAAKKRVSHITKEFTDGFRFIEKYPKSVTFFGSARLKEGTPYYEKARVLARRIASELNYPVITGGGPGIMEAANRGSFEGQGQSLGITIELPHEQVTNPYVTDQLAFRYFFSRKVAMTFSAEAYIYFPGGFGTLDELFEIITLVQTNKIEKVPIIMVGEEFWKPLENFFREKMLAMGTIDRDDLNLFTVTDDEDTILRIVQNARIRNGVPYHYQD